MPWHATAAERRSERARKNAGLLFRIRRLSFFLESSARFGHVCAPYDR